MPHWKGSYAENVPHFFDFVVEADTEEEADAKIKAALNDGKFQHISQSERLIPFYENEGTDQRAFINGPAEDDELDGSAGPLLSEVIKEADRLETSNTATVYACAECGREFADGKARDDHFMSSDCPTHNHVKVARDELSEILDDEDALDEAIRDRAIRLLDALNDADKH